MFNTGTHWLPEKNGLIEFFMQNTGPQCKVKGLYGESCNCKMKWECGEVEEMILVEEGSKCSLHVFGMVVERFDQLGRWKSLVANPEDGREQRVPDGERRK